MLSKRCALVSRLESVRPGARAGSEGLAEIGAAAGLFADAVDLCVMAAAAGTGGHSDRTEANALCLRSCTLTCSALRYSSITFSSLPAITPTDVSRFKVFVSLYLLFCACLDNSYSVMEQSLGVIYQAFGRAVALLGTTASTPRAPPALRSVSAQCWALYASNTVAFAGSVPAQLKDMMVASFLVREVTVTCPCGYSTSC